MTDRLIRIIDDEEEVRDSLGLLLECAGHTVTSYDSAENFLAKDDLTIPGCVLSDIRMPGMSGLELQVEMIRRHITLPLIFITGHGDIEMAADAILADQQRCSFLPILHTVTTPKPGRAASRQKYVLLFLDDFFPYRIETPSSTGALYSHPPDKRF